MQEIEKLTTCMDGWMEGFMNERTFSQLSKNVQVYVHSYALACVCVYIYINR